MNWQDDPELQARMHREKVRGRLLRSTLIWGPPFLLCLGALLFFALDRFVLHEYGSTIFLLVVLTIFSGLFGFQAVQSFLDYIGEPVSETGRVSRRWARSDSFVIKTHYIRLGKHILRGDQLLLDGIREGDYVEATFYPHSAVLVAVEKREPPLEGELPARR
jgi:hypothetical protein